MAQGVSVNASILLALVSKAAIGDALTTGHYLTDQFTHPCAAHTLAATLSTTFSDQSCGGTAHVRGSPSRGRLITPGEGVQNALARAIAAVAQSEGDYQTAVPQMTLHRRDTPTEPLHCIYNLGVAVLAQGEKQTLLGRKSLTFRPGESMLTTIDVPAVSHVSRATAREPFLGVMLLLDARSVMQAAADFDLPPPPRRDDVSRSIAVHPVDAHLLDAFVRLLKLLGEPAMVPRLAPLILQEITIRLLTGPHAAQLRHLVTIGSPSQQIAKTIAWLRKHFTEPLSIDDLAARSQMSPCTFRQHFRRLTGRV